MIRTKLSKLLKKLQHHKDRALTWAAYKIIMRSPAAEAWVKDPLGMYLMYHSLRAYEMWSAAERFREHFVKAGVEVLAFENLEHYSTPDFDIFVL
jgi:hypothetical protein